MKLEIKKIGNSTGLILPKELLARLGLEQGDEVVVTEMADGFAVKRGDDTFEKGIEIARKAMKTYRNTLKELAK
jgi:putative addiction module antidote